MLPRLVRAAYFFGVIHGDFPTHLGNTRCGRQGPSTCSISLIRTFQPSSVGGVIDTIHALMRDNRALAGMPTRPWGLRNMSLGDIAVLNRGSYVLRAVMDDRARKLQDTSPGYGARSPRRCTRTSAPSAAFTQPRGVVSWTRPPSGLGSVFSISRPRSMAPPLQQPDRGPSSSAGQNARWTAFKAAEVPMPSRRVGCQTCGADEEKRRIHAQEQHIPARVTRTTEGVGSETSC